MLSSLSDPRFLFVVRLDPNQGCTKSTCPVSDPIYDYTPSLAATIIFLVLFALSGITHTWQGIRYRSWFFASVMVIGCTAEVLGYVAKLMLWNDPFSSTGFQLNVVVLTFAPAFYSAGIYYTLKHITLTFGPSFSRLHPSLYTWVFISCDLLSIILQAVGGGTASAAKNNSVLRIGDDITIAGLVSQVFTLVVFGLCTLDYAIAVRQNSTALVPETVDLRRSLRFKLFLAALVLSYLTILLRCAYRVAELAKGWGPDNDILRNQSLFIGLDSVPCVIATLVLNVWHPGSCFPKHKEAEARKSTVMSSDEEERGIKR